MRIFHASEEGKAEDVRCKCRHQWCLFPRKMTIFDLVASMIVTALDDSLYGCFRAVQVSAKGYERQSDS